MNKVRSDAANQDFARVSGPLYRCWKTANGNIPFVIGAVAAVPIREDVACAASHENSCTCLGSTQPTPTINASKTPKNVS